jgi:sugar lactone lactonase YvrE
MPRFEPHAWSPEPAPPLEGAFAPNTRLADGDLLAVGANGPEDVVLDASGTAYCGTADGTIRSVSSSGVMREVAHVGGRPLGIEWYGSDLLVCNADRGLQLVSLNGAMETLADGFEDTPFQLTNNAAVSSDGTIYFTVSSTRRPFAEYITDMLEGQPTGRLFARAPSGALTMIADGIQFANGVALDPEERSVFVAETPRYRVNRYWIAGERVGQVDRFLENLPGFPDNLTFAGDTLWVPLASPRQAIVDFINPRPWLRYLSNALPNAVKPKPLRHGIVLGYGIDGSLRHNLQDKTGSVAITTSARYHDGRLFVGSLHDPHIAVVDVS